MADEGIHVSPSGDGREDVPPKEWVPLAEVFTAPNGIVVEVISSDAVLAEMGDFFGNALELAGFRGHVADRIVRGVEHVYRTMRDGTMLSCGELRVKGGKVVVDFDRALRNRRGTKETGEAVAAFADAVNRGDVALAWDVGEDGFILREPAATPTP